MENNLPSRYESWYAFWLDIKDHPEAKGQEIRIPKGGLEVMPDDLLAWERWSIQYIKAKAFEDVEKFLPTRHDEVSELVLMFGPMRFEDSKKRDMWHEFHNLL